jgi:hypothetical protein
MGFAIYSRKEQNKTVLREEEIIIIIIMETATVFNPLKPNIV